jgi:tetratricopeptide (TPR) repeat protein
MPFSDGENVGPYRIVEKLGQGGMATVFKAYHPSLDRYVAIKVLHPALQSDPNFQARFQREARIVAKLEHPHIVPVYDFAEHGGHPFLVMRFVEGETLKARLQQGPLDHDEVISIARAVSEALVYAHRAGVLHRDVKPSNIIITPGGHVWLTDFGVARMAEAGESTLSRDMMVGTPQYIAPEQAKGDVNLDARTDIYSLGVVLYEMLVGQVPFQADTPFAVIHDHIFTPLPLPRSRRPDLPEAVERLLLKALAKDPDDRFQSVKELLAAFDVVIASEPSAPPEVVAAPAETVVTPSAEVAEAVVTETTAEPPEMTAEEAVEEPAMPRVEDEVEDPSRPRRRRWLWVGTGLFAVLCLAAFGAFAARRALVSGLLSGEEVDPTLEAARLARGQGDERRAMELYREAVANDPHLEEAYAEGTDLLLSTGNPEAATAFLREGLEQNPDSVPLHYALADLTMGEGRWDEAWQAVDWLLAEVPDAPYPHAYAGMLTLFQGGPCVDARSELERALEIEPDLAWAHFGMAVCYLRDGEKEEATIELQWVLDHEVDDELRYRAEYRMAILDQELEQPISEAFADAMAAIHDIPDEDLREMFKEMIGLAKVAWDMGDGRGAVDMVSELNRVAEENREVLGLRVGGRLRIHLTRLIELMAIW